MKLAIFDFDGTLFPKETLPFMLSRWNYYRYPKIKLAKAYLSLLPLYLRYKMGINSTLTHDQMRVMAVHKFNRIFVGMSKSEINQFFIKVAQSTTEFLNQSVVVEIEKANREGSHTVLLSGAYRLFLSNIGETLGINTVIGTEIYFSNGFFDPQQEPDIVCGSSKLDKLNVHFGKQMVDWTASSAFADSFSDLPLLERVGQPVAVNPDPKLNSIAVERGWRIIS